MKQNKMTKARPLNVTPLPLHAIQELNQAAFGAPGVYAYLQPFQNPIQEYNSYSPGGQFYAHPSFPTLYSLHAPTVNK